ncbi:MAG: phosphatidylserine/phosphatidylglycerophosphate/cardiolipin synthase family protein [Isosphaeraceae bacterium]
MAGASADICHKVTLHQKLCTVRDVLQATSHDMLTHPLRTARICGVRASEKLGVRLCQLGPDSIPVAPPAPSFAEVGGPPTVARITTLIDGSEGFDALFRTIASASSRIDLMIFGWDDDETGRAVASALIERARAGVSVRLLVDRGGFVLGQGNAEAVRGSRSFLHALRAEPRILVIEAPNSLARFDHRKALIVDDQIAWSGGMILVDGERNFWHDLAFLVEGPIVAQYANLFEERWTDLGGESSPRFPTAYDPRIDYNSVVRMVRTDDNHRCLKDSLYGAIDAARSRIILENPYFSDPILVDKLLAARARGVDVRAVVTVEGNMPGQNVLSARSANRLLAGGVSVYLYPGMTHVKAMTVDGIWSYIGTGNFDELSLRNNREVGLTVQGDGFASILEARLFLPDQARSRPMRQPLAMPTGWRLVELLELWH